MKTGHPKYRCSKVQVSDAKSCNLAVGYMIMSKTWFWVQFLDTCTITDLCKPKADNMSMYRTSSNFRHLLQTVSQYRGTYKCQLKRFQSWKSFIETWQRQFPVLERAEAEIQALLPKQKPEYGPEQLHGCQTAKHQHRPLKRTEHFYPRVLVFISKT